MYSARDTLQYVIKTWWKVAWQKARKALPVFFFVNEHNNTNTKPQAIKKKATIFKVIPEEKQQHVEEKDSDNVHNVDRPYTTLFGQEPITRSVQLP